MLLPRIDVRSSNTHPEVAVIVPCYNYAHFLPDAIESVVAQTWPHIDCLIVDDGSPDDTHRVAEKLIAAYPERRIRLLRKENGGLSSARNAGVRATSSPLILPLDADDVFSPFMVEKLLEVFLEEPDTAVAVPDGRHFCLSEARLGTRVPDLPTLLETNPLVYASMFRREVFEAVGGYGENMKYGYEDWDFWIGAMKRGFHFRHVGEELFFYRRHGKTMIDEADEKGLWLRSRIVLNHPEFFPEKERAFAKAILDLGEGEPDLQLRLRIVLHLMGKKRDAEVVPHCARILDEGRQVLPSTLLANLHYIMGMGHIARKDWESARFAFKTSLDLAPCNHACQRHLGMVYGKLDQADVGVKHLQDAIEMEPDDPSFHKDLGVLLTSMKRFEEARESFEQALALDPAGPDSLEVRAWLARVAGREGLCLEGMDSSMPEKAADSKRNHEAPDRRLTVP